MIDLEFGLQTCGMQAYCLEWLINDDDIKALAPNMQVVDDDSVQVSGVIQIPTRCVVKLTRLRELALTCA